MARLNRRDFFKVLGVTSGASVASACGLDDNFYRQPFENILPYVVRPDQVVPGTPTFFATTVTSGPRAFPVVARHRDGRVIHVGANRMAPVPGAVPRASLFELQRHYSRDRIQEPHEGGDALEWDEAIARLATSARAAREAGRKVVYLGGYRSGAILNLIESFTDQAIFWEPLGREAEANAAEALFGERLLPAYDLSQAHYVLSFGADFLGDWGSTTHATQYGEARNPNQGGFIARFALVSPHQGQTGGNADDWFAVRPGSEALVARALGRLVADLVGYEGPLLDLVADADIDAAAQEAGLERRDLEAIAAQFAGAPAAVALPGGMVGASAAATDLAVATYALNLIAGQGGVTFGLGPVYRAPVHGLGELEDLVAEMEAGEVGVLLIDSVNPLHDLPTQSGFREALAHVGLVAALTSHPDETQARATLTLPTSDPLEDWGDEEPEVGFRLLRQPAMSPLYPTRSLGDILLQAGKEAWPEDDEDVENDDPNDQDVGLGFRPETWRDYLRQTWEREVFPQAQADASFDAWWHETLGNGFAQVPTPLEDPEVEQVEYSFGPSAVPNGEGLFLVAYPHPFKIDGRYANEPWAQETPEPMTGNVWDTWVEVAPQTAERLGLRTNSLVEVVTDAGTISLGVQVYRGVQPDTVAIALGGGHEAHGRYANGVGANVVQLLTAQNDGHGALAWQQSRVELRDTGRRANLVTTFGSDFDEHRQWGGVVQADELAPVGDEPAEVPGELTDIYAFKMDPRTKRLGRPDQVEGPEAEFYPPPDRPIYRFAMTADVNACNGCAACVVACYAENNLPIVGKQKVSEGREMSWLRINRYWGFEQDEPGPKEIRFVPMLCQHCGKAPCEGVCPVLATYHTIDGLNAMVYNRCAGTRYCSNNCPYKVRRFNWHSYVWPEPLNLQLNPDVSTRTMGVMEKCTFCVQRIYSVRSAYRHRGVDPVPNEALRELPACAEACPTGALVFGNLNDPESTPRKTRQSGRSYLILADFNTQPAINYLARATFDPDSGYRDFHGGADEEADPTNNGEAQ